MYKRSTESILLQSKIKVVCIPQGNCVYINVVQPQGTKQIETLNNVVIDVFQNVNLAVYQVTHFTMH